ncbi:intradiol ring-cleavage dioxygenase [Herpetosiphon giganteus]|uniref:dioxygenase family protein n=1 Tax=Herpetosiphon giganteus TaxID=2029754 RepID=UPI0019574481|nr:intradiol ring-cleavage dioxygenase [Herpetosiphon giganteus]MBM7846068.1 protocatechuate 3,4-dioxygenase beta subunit [Herpetosiphon giganteus]
MDNDDQPVGRILSRREVLKLFGLAGSAAVLAGCSSEVAPTATSVAQANAPTTTATTAATNTIGEVATATSAATSTVEATATSEAVAALPSCIVRPELTEGPYFVDEKLERSDIRSDPSNNAVSAGTQLDVKVVVSQIGAGTCTALAGAIVDLWHCDADGVYSDATDRSFNTVGQKFLRGYQRTDDAGVANFTTIYPGWYQGRAVHIHFKIRTDAGYEFTSQFFFDESLTDVVHAQAPYVAKGVRTLLNDGDGIYQQSAGQTILTVVPNGQGYSATFEIGLQI